MKITILTYVEDEGTEAHDIVVDHVSEALKAGGHKPSVLGIHSDVAKVVSGLKRRKPDLVFNLAEMFGDNLRADAAVAGLLELLGLPFTGGGSAELSLRQDKGLAKKVLAFEGLRYPDFAVISPTDMETGGNLRMPLFVKPLRTDASIGISGAKSLVHDATAMMKQVATIHKKLKDSALAEEYIEGREFYVGVLGNERPVAFPPIEMDFSGLPEGMLHVADAKAKFDTKSIEYKGTKSVLAQVPDEVRAKLQEVSIAAYRALCVRDYGRVDLRLSEAGDVYVIEVNANCYLEKTSEFATAAEAHGIGYVELVNQIAEMAVKRRR